MKCKNCGKVPAVEGNHRCEICIDIKDKDFEQIEHRTFRRNVKSLLDVIANDASNIKKIEAIASMIKEFHYKDDR